MCGSRHTGCLAGFAQVMTYTSQCNTWLEQNGSLAPKIKSNTRGEINLCGDLCHSILKAWLCFATVPPTEQTNRSPPFENHRTLILQLTSVTILGLGLVTSTNTAPRVYDGGLLHDKTILLQSGNVATGVGQ